MLKLITYLYKSNINIDDYQDMPESEPCQWSWGLPWVQFWCCKWM